jgi:Methylase involved in ubiquinone/menaquinone biosynthesis
MKNSKTNFSKSQWTNNGFAHEYLRDSDIYIPQREHVLQLIKLIFSFYVNNRIKIPHVIDLGCGDGALTKALIDVNKNLLSTLIDGSEHMLESARKNIPNINIRKTIHISFQDLYGSSVIEDDADIIVSSLAIHHLNGIEKGRLFKYIYAKLKLGGLFINYDPVLSPSQELEQLDLTIWKEWILNYEATINPRREKSLDYIPSQYKSNKDNVPSTLDSQLEMMKNAGFLDVNLFYKYGFFCLFGGRK